MTSQPEATSYPGESLGLPASGACSLASWRSRIAALLVDWAPNDVAALRLAGALQED